MLAIDNGEVEAEFLRKLVLPLQKHRGWSGDDDRLDATPQQHLSNDKAGLNSFAKTDVVSNQQVDAWQFQRLRQRKKLIGIQADARTKW